MIAWIPFFEVFDNARDWLTLKQLLDGLVARGCEFTAADVSYLAEDLQCTDPRGHPLIAQWHRDGEPVFKLVAKLTQEESVAVHNELETRRQVLGETRGPSCIT